MTSLYPSLDQAASPAVAPTIPAPPAPEVTSPAWWLHVLTLVLAVAAFVAAVIHPGYHIPTVVAASVGVAAIVLAGISTVFIMLEHHDFSLHKSVPIESYGRALLNWLEISVAPILAASANPELHALSTRLTNAEAVGNAALNLARANAVAPPPPAPQSPQSPQEPQTPVPAPPSGPSGQPGAAAVAGG